MDYSHFPILHAPSPTFKHFLEILPPQSQVLELGCRNGVTALQALNLRPDLKWVGIDNSAQDIKIANEMAVYYTDAGFNSPLFAWGNIEKAADMEATQDAPFDAIAAHITADLLQDMARCITFMASASDLLWPDGLAYIGLPGVFDSEKIMQQFLDKLFDTSVFKVVEYFPGIAYILKKY